MSNPCEVEASGRGRAQLAAVVLAIALAVPGVTYGANLLPAGRHAVPAGSPLPQRVQADEGPN